jgi:hypothetical protein
MKYHVKHLEHKNGHWVEVSRKERDISREAWMMFADGFTEEHMLEIAQWVLEHELGSRQSFNQWKLKNEAAVTAFKLKWG